MTLRGKDLTDDQTVGIGDLAGLVGKMTTVGGSQVNDQEINGEVHVLADSLQLFPFQAIHSLLIILLEGKTE